MFQSEVGVWLRSEISQQAAITIQIQLPESPRWCSRRAIGHYWFKPKYQVPNQLQFLQHFCSFYMVAFKSSTSHSNKCSQPQTHFMILSTSQWVMSSPRPSFSQARHRAANPFRQLKCLPSTNDAAKKPMAYGSSILIILNKTTEKQKKTAGLTVLSAIFYRTNTLCHSLVLSQNAAFHQWPPVLQWPWPNPATWTWAVPQRETLCAKLRIFCCFKILNGS